MDSDIDPDTSMSDVKPGDTMWFEKKADAEEAVRRLEEYLLNPWATIIHAGVRVGFLNKRSGRRAISRRGYRVWFSRV